MKKQTLIFLLNGRILVSLSNGFLTQPQYDNKGIIIPTKNVIFPFQYLKFAELVIQLIKKKK